MKTQWHESFRRENCERGHRDEPWEVFWKSSIEEISIDVAGSAGIASDACVIYVIPTSCSLVETSTC